MSVCLKVAEVLELELDRCELPCGCWDLNLGPLEEQLAISPAGGARAAGRSPPAGVSGGAAGGRRGGHGICGLKPWYLCIVTV